MLKNRLANIGGFGGVVIMCIMCMFIGLLMVSIDDQRSQASMQDNTIEEATESVIQQNTETPSPPTPTMTRTLTNSPTPTKTINHEATATSARSTQNAIDMTATVVAIQQLERTSTAEALSALGIGMSRKEIWDYYLDLGFTFKSGARVDGQRQIIGTSEGELALLQIIGPSENVINVSMVVFATEDNMVENTLNFYYLVELLGLITPDLEDPADWLIYNIELGANSASNPYSVQRTHQDILIDLTIDQVLDSIILTLTKAE